MSIRSTLRSTTMVAALALVFAGCGTVFRQPQVTLEGVELGGLGFTGGTVIVNVRVVNPNRFTLSADKLDYQLAVRDPDKSGAEEWVDFASGTHDERFTVGPKRTETVRVPVEFTYSSVGSAALALVRAGKFDYRATGSVDVQTPVGTHGVPFQKRGSVTMLGRR